MVKYNLTYSDKAKGWTSFHSYIPDWRMKVNNCFFNAKDGHFYRNKYDTNPIINIFCGEQFSSKMVTIFKEATSEYDIFKTLVLEGNKPLDASTMTNLAANTINFSDFNNRESRNFTYVRRNGNGAYLYSEAALEIGPGDSVDACSKMVIGATLKGPCNQEK